MSKYFLHTVNPCSEGFRLSLFRFEGRLCDLMVLAPDLCLPFYISLPREGNWKEVSKLVPLGKAVEKYGGVHIYLNILVYVLHI